MIYDATGPTTIPAEHSEKGYTIHLDPDPDCAVAGYKGFVLYTDDGRGNGDHVCSSPDRFWIERIAYLLDTYGASE